MSTRPSTAAPSFGARRDLAQPARGPMAWRHLRGRWAQLACSTEAMGAWVVSAIIVALFMAEAATMHPLYVLLSSVGGGALLWGLRHPHQGSEPMLPVSRRVRIAVDAALVLLPAVLLMPAVVPPLAALDAGVETQNLWTVFGLAGEEGALSEGLLGSALSAVLLSYPLLMASLRYPPRMFSYRAIIPALPIAALILLAWFLGLTATLLGALTVATAATALVLATAQLDWPDITLDSVTDFIGLGRRGPLCRDAREPTAQLRKDFGRGALQGSGLVVLCSALAAGLAVAMTTIQVTSVAIMVVVLPLIMLPRVLALASGLGVSLTATGLLQASDASPLTSLPVPRASIERWSLLHYVVVALVTLVCDLGMATVGLMAVDSERGRPAAVVMISLSAMMAMLLPWAAAAAHVLRFRWKTVARGAMQGLGLAAGAQVTPVLVALPYVLLGYLATQDRLGWMPGARPIELFYLAGIPGLLVLAAIWAALLGSLHRTIPNRV